MPLRFSRWLGRCSTEAASRLTAGTATVAEVQHKEAVDLSNARSLSPLASGVTATAIALGALHTCVIGLDGGVMCWGSNLFGQVGQLFGNNLQTSPVAVPGGEERSGALTFIHSLTHACTLHTNFNISLTHTQTT